MLQKPLIKFFDAFFQAGGGLVVEQALRLVGFGGDETPTMSVKGGSVLAGYQVTQPLGLGFEFDYFNFDNDPGTDAVD